MAEPFTNLIQANSFGPLTPEQQARMRQGVTTETINPFEFLVGGGVGAGIGRAVGRGVGHVGQFATDVAFPMISMLAGRSAAPVNWMGRAGGVIGGGMGISAADQLAMARAAANMNRDAEGQYGGFYGPPSSMDAEGQPGGFYGRRR